MWSYILPKWPNCSYLGSFFCPKKGVYLGPTVENGRKRLMNLWCNHQERDHCHFLIRDVQISHLCDHTVINTYQETQSTGKMLLKIVQLSDGSLSVHSLCTVTISSLSSLFSFFHLIRDLVSKSSCLTWFPLMLSWIKSALLILGSIIDCLLIPAPSVSVAMPVKLSFLTLNICIYNNGDFHYPRVAAAHSAVIILTDCTFDALAIWPPKLSCQ